MECAYQGRDDATWSKEISQKHPERLQGPFINPALWSKCGRYRQLQRHCPLTTSLKNIHRSYSVLNMFHWKPGFYHDIGITFGTADYQDGEETFENGIQRECYHIAIAIEVMFLLYSLSLASCEDINDFYCLSKRRKIILHKRYM